MNTFSIMFSVLALVCAAGCVSRNTAEEQARKAYQAGFEQGQATAEFKRTHVFVTGPVQYQQIVWHPDLTVAQAILEAVYMAPDDPSSIIVTRNGVPNPVDPQNLLRGIDFALEPGDTIQVIP